MHIFKKILYGILSVIWLCLPIATFILTWSLLNPQTFWEKILLIVLGIVFLTPIQAWLFIIWLMLLGAYCGLTKTSPTQYQFKSRINKF